MITVQDISKFNLFLKEIEIYNSNKEYWNKIITNLSPSFKEWMNTKFANGENINDGNPLVALRSGNIAIRIIQTERDVLQPKFASWEKQYTDLGVNELVICIQPYQTIYLETEYLIQKFLSNRHRRYLQRINVKYNDLLNKKRTSFLIDRLEGVILKPMINDNLFTDKLLIKNVREISRKLDVNDSTFKNKNIEKGYNQSINRANRINDKLSKKTKINSRKTKSLNNELQILKSVILNLKKEIEEQEKNIS